MLLLNPRRTRTNMKLLQLVWIFLLTLCGQSGITAMTVKEDNDVILDCSFGSTNIEKEPFDWKKDEDKNKKDVFFYSEGKPQPGPQFEGRVSHFPDQLRSGNASIKITKAKTSDSGTYTCYHATFPPELRSSISLTVGASSEPSVRTVDQTQNSALLRCEVRGAFPKPEVVWTDSDGKILDADEPKVTKTEGNKYDTVLDVTVSKTDNYTCVATQKEINHQINRTTFMRLNGGASKPDAKAINETKEGVLLQCVIQDPSPELKVSWKNKAGQDVPSKEQRTENCIILQTTVTKTDYYRCVTTEGKKDDELYDEIYVRGPVPDGASNGLVIGVGIASFLLGTIVVGATVWCWKKKQKVCWRFNTNTSRQQQQRGNSLTGCSATSGHICMTTTQTSSVFRQNETFLIPADRKQSSQLHTFKTIPEHFSAFFSPGWKNFDLFLLL